MPRHRWSNNLYFFSLAAVQFSKLESGSHIKYKIAAHRQLEVDNILWLKMRAARFLLLFISLLSPLMCSARGGRGGGRGGGSRGGLFRWGRSMWQKVLVEGQSWWNCCYVTFCRENVVYELWKKWKICVASRSFSLYSPAESQKILFIGEVSSGGGGRGVVVVPAVEGLRLHLDPLVRQSQIWYHPLVRPSRLFVKTYFSQILTIHWGWFWGQPSKRFHKAKWIKTILE